jgi:hypothetical protein
MYLSFRDSPCCSVMAKALTAGCSSMIRRPSDGTAVQIILRFIIALG